MRKTPSLEFGGLSERAAPRRSRAAVGFLDEDAGELLGQQCQAIGLVGRAAAVARLPRGAGQDALDPGDQAVEVEVAADGHRAPAADRLEVDPPFEDLA